MRSALLQAHDGRRGHDLVGTVMHTVAALKWNMVGGPSTERLKEEEQGGENTERKNKIKNL